MGIYGMPTEVEKVIAYITRAFENRTQVLVFEHQDMPEAGVQVPAGTLEPNESLEAAVLREVHEEAGIHFSGKAKQIGRFKWFRADRNELHYRNVFHLKSDITLKDEWLHEVSGHGEDHQMIFRFYWMDIEKAEKVLEVDQGKYLALLD